jgi:hypothetical protein
MFGDPQRSGVSRDPGRRPGRRGRRAGRTIRAAGLAALAAAGLWAATASGSAPPAGGATVFVHSATSGELGDGTLTLRGVSRRVTWAHNSGRSGVLAVRRMHRLLFADRKLAATGTLHVAGHRGGDELTFQLTKPRYNRTRHTVSYKIKRVGNGHLPSPAARAAGASQRRKFGAASLSIVGAAPGPFTTYVYTCDGKRNGCRGISGSGLKPDSEVSYIGVRGGSHAVARATQNGTVDIKLGRSCDAYVVEATGADGSAIRANFDSPPTCGPPT